MFNSNQSLHHMIQSDALCISCDLCIVVTVYEHSTIGIQKRLDNTRKVIPRTRRIFKNHDMRDM